ncbi:heterokaryon incompatibility protein, partial [Metarhizium majus ARSEF 297]
MNCGVSNAWTGRSPLKSPNSSQKKLLDAVASRGAGTELPQSHREQSAESGDLAGDATPVQARKRLLDATSEGDPSPAKRARSTRTDTQRPGVEDEKSEQAAETTRQEPKPKSPTRLHASSIEPKIKRPDRTPPTTRLRKRQIDSDSDSDSDNQHQLKRARLTRKNLALFDKMGKKKASAPPESTDDSNTTKTTSTTTSRFAIQARKNGMLNPLHSKPPTNLENIRKRHARSRATASPPESRFKRYANNVGKAANEATMVVEVSGRLLKEYDDDGYLRVFNQPFTGFPKDVGFNNGLSAPQPDFVEGLEMEEFRPFPVDEHVEAAVLYRDNPGSLTLPHLAGEWKGRGKDMEKAMLQSRYDGAALVHARNQALSYLGKSDPLGHAEVTTFTTDGTNVNFYAHYAAPAEDGTLEYHQYQYASTNVKDTYQGHKDGRRGLRNVQDHARDQSYALRDQLKGHWKQRGAFHPIGEEALLPVPDSTFDETNINEDEAGYEIVEQPCQPTPAASSEPHRASRSVSSLDSLPPANNYAPSSGGHK